MAEKSAEIQDPEKASLVDSGRLPTIQNSTLLESEQKNSLGTKNGNYIYHHHDDKRARGSAFRQILAALVAQLGTINTGMVFGFAAIANVQLQDSNDTLVTTSDQRTWIASTSAIGTPIGCLLSGYLMDIFGRKASLIVTEVPALFGWILISCATNVNMIYAGRFFTGLGSGMVGAPARVYASEVTQPHLRGMLTAFASVGVSTGVLIEYSLGSLLSWWVCAAISAILPLAALLLMFLFPETPSFLIAQNRPEQARIALQKFRDSNYNLDKEMNLLLNFSNKNNIKRLTGFRETINALLKPNAVKPFLILMLYFLIYQWTGTNAVTFYAAKIFQDSGATINKYLATVIIGIVRLIFTIVACILCRRCGRRPLTMISAFGCGISMLAFGIYEWIKVYWTDNNMEHSWTWFPLFCLIFYTAACTLGFLVIPWIMIGELYPVQVRGLLGGFTTMSAHAFVFTVVQTFPLLNETITIHGTYLLYGFISIFGMVYFYLCLPETKGKTLQEIEDYFSGRSDTLKTGLNSKLWMSRKLNVEKGQVLP